MPKFPQFDFLRLRFADERTERLYRLNQAQKNRRYLYRSTLGLLPMLVSLFLVSFKTAPLLGLSMTGNFVGFLGFLIPANIVFFLIARRNSKFYQNHDEWIRGLILLYAAAGSQVAFLMNYPSFYSTLVFPEMTVYQCMFYLLIRVRRNVAIFCGVTYQAIVTLAFLKWGVAPAGGFFSLMHLTLPVAVIGISTCHFLEKASRAYFRVDQQLGDEMARSRALLLNVLPEPVADQLQADPGRTLAERFEGVTVLFVDIVGFTGSSRDDSPERVVSRLNAIFRTFDEIVAAHGVEKIKTVGDAYMAVAGVPERVTDHADRAASVALEILVAASKLELEDGKPLRLRLGMHSGPAVAGVIGQTKFTYDIWGATVNLASRMESTGEPGKIQVSSETARLLGAAYELVPRGTVECKGIGAVDTCWLVRRRSNFRAA